ncbi:Hypothetical protein POVN_LOCUS725 [uncultured virus]|nr:Hypothetical protein POVN_LOCUS725 [uncultured virus]
MRCFAGIGAIAAVALTIFCAVFAGYRLGAVLSPSEEIKVDPFVFAQQEPSLLGTVLYEQFRSDIQGAHCAYIDESLNEIVEVMQASFTQDDTPRISIEDISWEPPAVDDEERPWFAEPALVLVEDEEETSWSNVELALIINDLATRARRSAVRQGAPCVILALGNLPLDNLDVFARGHGCDFKRVYIDDQLLVRYTDFPVRADLSEFVMERHPGLLAVVESEDDSIGVLLHFDLHPNSTTSPAFYARYGAHIDF